MVQHVQSPNDMMLSKDLAPKDLLVYLGIKRHYNAKTGQCNPSIRTLSKELRISTRTIVVSIKELINSQWIIQERKGRSVNYAFSKYKNFEPFTYEFLDNPNYTFQEKALLAAVQQYMVINKDGYGKITMPTVELATHLNLSSSTMHRTETSLKQKGALTIVENGANDAVIKKNKTERVYALERFAQGAAYLLKRHNEQLEEHEERLEKIEKEKDNFIKKEDIKEIEARVVAAVLKAVKPMVQECNENVKELGKIKDVTKILFDAQVQKQKDKQITL